MNPALRRVVCAAIFSIISVSATVSTKADLIAFYPFDNTGNPTQDVSGHNTSLASDFGSPTYQASGGYEGGAFQFDGNDIFQLGVNLNSITGFTVGGWVNADTLLSSGLYKWFGTDNAGFDPVMVLDNRDPIFNTDHSFRFTAFTGAASPNTLRNTPGYVGGQWVFMAMTYTGNASGAGTLTLYIDADAASHGDGVQSLANAGNFNGSFTTAAIGGIRPDNTSEG